jgi:uncharacterized membrane protein YphA (DoxX/SURF4 family)
MFHADHTPIQVLAHVLIAALFVIVGVRNMFNWDGVIKRMTELKVPMPRLSFPLALVVQFAGAALVLADFHAQWGAVLLIGFTIITSAYYHRYWTYGDPRQSATHFQFACNNLAVIGGLLLII